MLKLKLDYDKAGLKVNLPEASVAKVFAMKNLKALESPGKAIKRSLLKPTGTSPLPTLARGKKRVCIVISDKTRPVPNKLILPPLLALLKHAGVRKENITILIGTGTHEPTEGKYLVELLGKKIIKEYRIENHNCLAKKDLAYLGKALGVSAWVNKTYFEADLKIVTGFIEPHFMAGFSGGRKGICPGIAGLETIKVFHSPKLLESKYAAGGNLRRNPCHALASEFSRLAGMDFLLNVTLNAKKQITGVFSGHQIKAFEKGIEFCRKSVTDHAKEKFDLVLTSGGGAPLDRNFYQTVKGIVGALEVVKKGGTIIIASGCKDGVGSRHFKELLRGMKSPEQYVRKISKKGFFCLDQWQVEELAKAMKKAKVKLFTGGLSKEDTKIAGLFRIDDINKEIKIETQKNKKIKIGVIPNGPYVLARLKA